MKTPLYYSLYEKPRNAPNAKWTRISNLSYQRDTAILFYQDRLLEPDLKSLPVIRKLRVVTNPNPYKD